jgi:hypothetical protein
MPETFLPSSGRQGKSLGDVLCAAAVSLRLAKRNPAHAISMTCGSAWGRNLPGAALLASAVAASGGGGGDLLLQQQTALTRRRAGRRRTTCPSQQALAAVRLGSALGAASGALSPPYEVAYTGQQSGNYPRPLGEVGG